MRPVANVALQVAALAASVALRLKWGGIETAVFVLSGLGPVLMLVPTMLAVFLLLHLRVLAWPLWVPFAGMAAGMLLASLLMAGYQGADEPFIPLFELLELPGRRSSWAALTNQAGRVAMWSFPVFLVWSLVAATVRLNREAARSVEKPGASIG